MSTNDSVERYERVSRKVKEVETRLDRLEGKQEQQEEELKNLGFNSIFEAKNWVEKAEKERGELEVSISEDLDRAEEIANGA